MKGGIYHIDGGIYQGIYLGIYQGIYHLDILLIPWYIPWYIAKVVYTTFGVVYTMTQPSRGWRAWHHARGHDPRVTELELSVGFVSVSWLSSIRVN